MARYIAKCSIYVEADDLADAAHEGLMKLREAMPIPIIEITDCNTEKTYRATLTSAGWYIEPLLD